MKPTRPTFPLHLLLIAIFPVLSLYAHNLTQIAVASIWRGFAIFLLAAILLFAMVFLVVRKVQQAALITSWGLLAFFLVVPLVTTLQTVPALKAIARLRYVFPLFAVIFVSGLAFGIRKIKNAENFTQIFNAVAIALLVLPVYQIVSYSTIFLFAAPHQEDRAQSTHVNAAQNTDAYPDVYYIVLDMHGRTDTIKSATGYDNSAFIEQLQTAGFYVAQCSNANYPSATWQSMDATLNMNYLDHDTIRAQSAVRAYSDGVYHIQHSAVVNKFQSLGYTVINFNTRWDFLGSMGADIYYDLVTFPGTRIKQLSFFEYKLINATPLGYFADYFNLLESNRAHYDNISAALQKLPQIPTETASPKFVYAHLVVPHPPYVFSASGEYIANPDSTRPDLEKYADQVAFIDNQMIAIVKQILANSPTPPIIIIQGDHGYKNESKAMSATILNAYYLPGSEAAKEVYPSISPVNSFRLILRSYFDEPLELLPDTIYLDVLHPNWGLHMDNGIPYDFERYDTPACDK